MNFDRYKNNDYLLIAVSMKFWQTYPGSTIGLLLVSAKTCLCKQFVIEETAFYSQPDRVFALIAINPLITTNRNRDFSCLNYCLIKFIYNFY